METPHPIYLNARGEVGYRRFQPPAFGLLRLPHRHSSVCEELSTGDVFLTLLRNVFAPVFNSPRAVKGQEQLSYVSVVCYRVSVWSFHLLSITHHFPAQVTIHSFAGETVVMFLWCGLLSCKYAQNRTKDRSEERRVGKECRL